MRSDQKSLRIGATVILCAILLRLFSVAFPKGFAKTLEKTIPAMIFLETGRTGKEFQEVIHIPSAQTEPPTEQTQPITTAPEENLQEESPTVLILHTHTCESYTGSTEEPGYRTQDPESNMLRVGQALADALTAAGIGVIHDQTVHDYPSYNGSYDQARATIQAQLAANPGITLVLDLHRDAVQAADGSQTPLRLQAENTSFAQLMLVVGSGNHYQVQPEWEQNLALANQLQALLEAQVPGLCRPLCQRPHRYNQDLSTGALIVEVGAAGNTMEEALASVQILAQAIISLSSEKPG